MSETSIYTDSSFAFQLAHEAVLYRPWPVISHNPRCPRGVATLLQAHTSADSSSHVGRAVRGPPSPMTSTAGYRAPHRTALTCGGASGCRAGPTQT